MNWDNKKLKRRWELIQADRNYQRACYTYGRVIGALDPDKVLIKEAKGLLMDARKKRDELLFEGIKEKPKYAK